LQSVSNVGPVTAAAFVAAIHEASRFRRGHEVEAYRGLVPRQLSSGETQRRGADHQSGFEPGAVAAHPSAVSCSGFAIPGRRHCASGRVASIRRGKGIAVVVLAPGSRGSCSRSCTMEPCTSRLDAMLATLRRPCQLNRVRAATALLSLS